LLSAAERHLLNNSERHLLSNSRLKVNLQKIRHIRSRCLVVAIFGDVCTYGILYSVGRLPDRAMDRAANKKPKVQKITEITELCHL